MKKPTFLKFSKQSILGLITGLLTTSVANADLLVDRGLPTANLNNAAGANRANVAWVDGAYAAGDYIVYGDSFVNTSSQTWIIDTIRVWTIGTTATATLLGGIQGSTIAVVSTAATISSVTYADSSSYQRGSGAIVDIHAIDFAVNIILGAGQTYDFFLDGTGNTDGTPDYVIPYLHASNAGLSGSPQDGSDDTMLQAEVSSGIVGNVTPWTSLGNGWDKASDFNVQVSGHVPDTGVSIALFCMALGGLAVFKRRTV